MSWLRLDDGFTRNPKFAGWTPAQKWAWLEVLEYCARYDTEGVIPDDLSLMPRSTTPALLGRAEASGFVDRRRDGALIVHDWEHYNPSNSGLEEAVVAYLTEHPKASANDVCREVRGSRKRILAAVSRFRSGSESGSESVPGEPVSGTKPVTRAGAPARAHGPRPVPSVPNKEPSPTPPPVATDDATGGTGAGAGDGEGIERLSPHAELDRLAREAAT